METITVGNKVLKIDKDECPMSPREWDNLGKMVFFHNRMNLPNELKIDKNSFSSWRELYDYLVKHHNAVVILPVYMLDHSGVWFRVGEGFGDVDPHGWDWGQVGYIVATIDAILDNFTGWKIVDGKNVRMPMKKRITKKMIEQVREILKGEVEEYGKYVNGEVYCYSLYEKGRHIESVGGFYDFDSIADNVPDEFKERIRQKQFD